MVETTRPCASSELFLGRRAVVFWMREDCQLDAGKEIMALRWGGGPLLAHQRIYKVTVPLLSAILRSSLGHALPFGHSHLLVAHNNCQHRFVMKSVGPTAF